MLPAFLLACAATGCVSAPAKPEAGAAPPAHLPQELAAAIGADAARRGGVESTLLRWKSAEAVTWSDGSLGCPQPGRMYTQALVPGWLIVVEAGGQALHYHAGVRGGWVMCPAGRREVPRPDSRI